MMESTQAARDRPRYQWLGYVAGRCDSPVATRPTAAHSGQPTEHHSDDASSRTGGTLDATSSLLLPAGRLHVVFVVLRLHVVFVVLTDSGKVLVLSSCRQRTTKLSRYYPALYGGW